MFLIFPFIEPAKSNHLTSDSKFSKSRRLARRPSSSLSVASTASTRAKWGLLPAAPAEQMVCAPPVAVSKRAARLTVLSEYQSTVEDVSRRTIELSSPKKTPSPVHRRSVLDTWETALGIQSPSFEALVFDDGDSVGSASVAASSVSSVGNGILMDSKRIDGDQEPPKGKKTSLYIYNAVATKGEESEAWIALHSALTHLPR